jgi:hypothetical protein
MPFHTNGCAYAPLVPHIVRIPKDEDSRFKEQFGPRFIGTLSVKEVEEFSHRGFRFIFFLGKTRFLREQPVRSDR